MLGNVAPTPFDLRFTLFGIPVRVHPLFWLVSAAMGWTGFDHKYTVIWVVCVFISILIHELGHALTAQYFGWPPHIVLYSFGGYASYQPGWGYTTLRRILIGFAGPMAGFLFYGIIFLVRQSYLNQLVHPGSPASYALRSLEHINLWWGLVNLLPVYPLDGGQIGRELLVKWNPANGVRLSLQLSLIFGGLVAILFYQHGDTYAALLFGALAVENLMSLSGPRHNF